MGSDLREALAAAMPDAEDRLLFYGKGSKRPPYNMLDVAETLKKFCAEILPASPFTDPRGIKISIVKGNFPKLAGLAHKTLKKEELRATEIIQQIESGTFDLGDYDPTRDESNPDHFLVR
jgi:hypothetical protein